MYATLVSAVDHYYVGVVTAAGESTMVKHVFMGEAGKLDNADIVQASGSNMTCMYTLLVSAIDSSLVEVVTAAVESHRSSMYSWVRLGCYKMQIWCRLVFST